MKEDRGTRPARRQQAGEYLGMTLGIVIAAIGVHFFKFPNHFATGGVTGIAVVLARLIPGLSVTSLNNLMNIGLLITGLMVLGRDFGIKTIYCTLLLSLMLFALEKVAPLTSPLTDQPFMELMFAMLLSAFGAGILFHLGASSGGTDVIAMILKQRAQVYSIGTALVAVDFLAAAATFLVFDIKTGLFSLFGLLIRGALLSAVLQALKQRKYFHIITNQPDLVRGFIISTLGRSATIFEGRGAYTGEERTLLITVVSAREAVRLKEFVKQHCSASFLLITNTDDILGKGFRNAM